MSVDVISFSAHADFRQTSGFVEALDPAHVVLVHGEAVEMGRLRKVLFFLFVVSIIPIARYCFHYCHHEVYYILRAG